MSIRKGKKSVEEKWYHRFDIVRSPDRLHPRPNLRNDDRMKNLYLILAIIGAVVPNIFFIDFIGTAGLDGGAFIAALFVNGAAGGFTADVLISSVVFWIYMFSRRKGPKLWIFVVLNLSVGLSCALPAYLYATSSNHHET